MEQKHTSNAVEEESVDSAHSEESVKQTQPENQQPPEEKDASTDLAEEMAKLPSLDLLKISLASMVIIHQRAVQAIGEEEEKETEEEKKGVLAEV